MSGPVWCDNEGQLSTACLLVNAFHSVHCSLVSHAAVVLHNVNWCNVCTGCAVKANHTYSVSVKTKSIPRAILILSGTWPEGTDITYHATMCVAINVVIDRCCVLHEILCIIGFEEYLPQSNLWHYSIWSFLTIFFAKSTLNCSMWFLAPSVVFLPVWHFSCSAQPLCWCTVASPFYGAHNAP